ncbi:hypothetical protein FG93_01084 [Bosea sp. LC85]|uniref:hypothetical protein n=1 Tax=Bosea sp. LC85 TaxID=1502851 RepID=UPI0004E2B24D|nr:hypothetical protein [Bosea sp. LC85]KFC74498.1 hypothetical protein FG93_01084 [Bosea sp. LC85]
MSQLRADSLANRLGTASLPTDTIVQGTAKVWGKVDMTTAITVNDSFNVASVIDLGTGLFTAALAVANGNAHGGSAGNAGVPGNGIRGMQAAYDSAAVIRHAAFGNSFALSDVSHCNFVGWGH